MGDAACVRVLHDHFACDDHRMAGGLARSTSFVLFVTMCHEIKNLWRTRKSRIVSGTLDFGQIVDL